MSTVYSGSSKLVACRLPSLQPQRLVGVSRRSGSWRQLPFSSHRQTSQKSSSQRSGVRALPKTEGSTEISNPYATLPPVASLGSILLAAGAPLTLAAHALADEAAADSGAATQQLADAAQTVTENAARGPTPLDLVIILSPILLYGIFSLYRAKINPKAKLADFAFIVAGLVIVANLISIIVFKVRFF